MFCVSAKYDVSGCEPAPEFTAAQSGTCHPRSHDTNDTFIGRSWNSASVTVSDVMQMLVNTALLELLVVTVEAWV